MKKNSFLIIIYIIVLLFIFFFVRPIFINGDIYEYGLECSHLLPNNGSTLKLDKIDYNLFTENDTYTCYDRSNWQSLNSRNFREGNGLLFLSILLIFLAIVFKTIKI